MTRFEASALATPAAISDLTERVMAFLREQGVDGRTTHHVALVLDEVLTNLGTHGGCCDSPARIAVSVAPDRVIGEVVDRGRAFDPRSAPEPTLHSDSDDRPIGGLGLHLVRKFSCTLEYVRRNEENWTTFAVSRGESAKRGEA